MFYFGAATLTAVLVHQDSLADVRQDWLMRPIRRRDLLAAKLLFVVLAAQLPLFLSSLACGLIDGFPVSSILAASFTENFYFLLGFTLPIFAFVSLTKNLTEALGGAFALLVGVMGLELLIAASNGGSVLGPTAGSGITWIPQTERLLIYLLVAAAILGLQYFRRASRASRYVLTQLAPWSFAFAFQKALSGALASEPPIRFDPTLGKFHSPIAAESASGDTQFNTKGSSLVTEKGTEIYLPLEVNGLASGSILKIDRASVHLVSTNGNQDRSISTADEQGGFEVPNDGTSQTSTVTHFEPIEIRGSIFNRIKNAPVAL